MIERCLTKIGTKGFLDPFLKLVELTTATQILSISCGEERPTCLLARNFLEHRMATSIASYYVNTMYKVDPLWETAQELQTGSHVIFNYHDIKESLPRGYKDALFRYRTIQKIDTWFKDKQTILISGSKLTLMINLYYIDLVDYQKHQTLLSIIAHLALQHFETFVETDANYPTVLDGLSERERQVCQGILSGKKAERIAADMRVATSTVVTYRKRAYQKLGISSRSSLFEICKE